MPFLADQQTITDLNVLGKYSANSLFSLFNKVVTAGGEKLLDDMFRHPLTEQTVINNRCSCFAWFTAKPVRLPFNADEFAAAEHYLISGGGNDGYLFSLIHAGRRAVLNKMGLKEEYETVQTGLKSIMSIVKQLITFLRPVQKETGHPFFQEVNTLLTAPSFLPVIEAAAKDEKSSGLLQVAELDHLFRSKCYVQVQDLFQLIYQLDVAIAVGMVAAERGFIYPLALPADAGLMEIKCCRHPALEHAAGNDFMCDELQNVCFLTGANMAGKSTFMKSVGAACYLAHMGFPVAATAMRFSVKQGIFSSINVADNLNQGISHFYAEVLRVKEVATAVCAGQHFLVIFDELFKGTNVKDAYDATLECTKAFGQFRRSNFIISTHIIEVGEELRNCDNVQFRYMPTVMKENIPTYTYCMQEGITTDRQGMMIIENEGILDMME